MESINSLDEISTRDLAIAIKAENKDNRYEFYKDVKINENLPVSQIIPILPLLRHKNGGKQWLKKNA